MIDKCSSPKHLMILGTRGIPASYGGFETFAEQLSRGLVSRGWKVTVYCQVSMGGDLHESHWEGIRLINIPARDTSPLATILFDFKSTIHAASQPGIILTLGYNTAVFLGWYKLRGRRNIINMDGIEWRRSKWSLLARTWLYCNERMATWFASHLVADNPGIKEHLLKIVAPKHVSMIPYGAPSVDTADQSVLQSFGLEANQYVLIVARAEPENSILEIVEAFTSKRRKFQLVIIGKYLPESTLYHQQVLGAINEDVIMLGAIYNPKVLNALRFFSRLYVHGHQVGGTNPSLVEALGAGNPILAHDNKFNHWVAGNAGLYFSSVSSCAQHLDAILEDEEQLDLLRSEAIKRHSEVFQWPTIIQQYDTLLSRWYE